MYNQLYLNGPFSEPGNGGGLKIQDPLKIQLQDQIRSPLFDNGDRDQLLTRTQDRLQDQLCLTTSEPIVQAPEVEMALFTAQETAQEEDLAAVSATQLEISLNDAIAAAPEARGPGGGNGGGNGGGGGRPDNPGGGGGHTETAGNNLSFPVIFPYGVTPLTLRGDMDSLTLTDPYWEEPGEFTPPDLTKYSGEFVPADMYWFHQKSDGNVWQAYNEVATGSIDIDKIDVGDALESARLELNQFVRIELALLKDLASPQLAYNMENIYGQGKTEVQGTPLNQSSLTITDNLSAIEALDGITTYPSDLATVYAPSNVMNLAIQKFEGDPVTGLWDGDKWVGEGIGERDYAANTAFGAELTVSGKVISGVSGKPFKFTDEGNYRITFEIENNASIFLDVDTEAYNVAGAREMEIVADPEVSGIGENNHNGLIYLDVQVPSTVAGDELTSQFSNFAADANWSGF